MNYKRHVYPIPEAVDEQTDRRWHIQPSQRTGPRVYLKHSLLLVPLDDSPQSRLIRNHELGHIRWSPMHPEQAARRNGLDFDVLQAVEDMRINTKLDGIGVDTQSGSISRPVLEAFAEDLLQRGDFRNMVLAMVAITGQGTNENLVREKFQGQPPSDKAVQIAEMARKIMWDKGAPRFHDTIRTAKWLQALLSSAAPMSATRFPKLLHLSKTDQEHLNALMKMLGDFGTGARATKKVPWGRMNVETPPRPHKVSGYLGKGRTASDEGVIPRYAHRLLVDGRVFCRIRRQRGGAILIDCSGSMNLTSDDLKRILSHSPGAVVACYSGNSHDGVLRVLAQAGRQVEENWIGAPAGGSNVIDRPALDWLSKQAKPRIWVCDGQVTGVGDRQSAINTLECEALCRQRGIVRQDNVGLAVAMLQKLDGRRNG
jgi:hypothetical protein